MIYMIKMLYYLAINKFARLRINPHPYIVTSVTYSNGDSQIYSHSPQPEPQKIQNYICKKIKNI